MNIIIFVNINKFKLFFNIRLNFLYIFWFGKILIYIIFIVFFIYIIKFIVLL